MATLKSQKMVRGRDLKTPLAASAMDKKSNGKKGGPGDPPKKKSKFPVTKGKVNIYSTEGKKMKSLTQSNYDALNKSGRGLKAGTYKKVPGGYMMVKDVGGDSTRASRNPSGVRHPKEVSRKHAVKKY